jgi:hypothetical protein
VLHARVLTRNVAPPQAAIRAVAVPPPRDNPALLAALETAARRHLSVLFRSALDVAANAAASAGTAARDAASPLAGSVTCVRAAVAERDAALAACDAAKRRAQAAEDALRDMRLRVARLETQLAAQHDGDARTPRRDAALSHRDALPSWLLPPSPQQRTAAIPGGRQRRRSGEVAVAGTPPPRAARSASAGHSRPASTSAGSGRVSSPASAPRRGRGQLRDWSRTLRGGSGYAPVEALAFTPHSRLAVSTRHLTPAAQQPAHAETPAWSTYAERAPSSGEERSARTAGALAVH